MGGWHLGDRAPSHPLYALPPAGRTGSKLRSFPQAGPGWLPPRWHPIVPAHRHLKCHRRTSQATLTSAAPDGEPEGKQSRRLFPEAFYSVHQREDRLSNYTWLITPFISETPHPKSLAMMMCTLGYSPALLLTCSVNSSEIALSHNQPEIKLLVLPSAANP